MKTVSVAFFGQTESGKTSLIRRFVHGAQIIEHTPTIEDVYNTIVEVGDNEVNLKITDTTSEEDLELLKTDQYTKNDILVFVYSVTEKYAFSRMKEDMLQSYAVVSDTLEEDKKPTFVIVANKIDLKERVITRKDGLDLVSNMKALCSIFYFETSAFENIKVDFLFDSIAKGFQKKEEFYKKRSFDFNCERLNMPSPRPKKMTIAKLSLSQTEPKPEPKKKGFPRLLEFFKKDKRSASLSAKVAL
ncbi:hypothetical protein EIN_085550 [Entamoeba invadens IP1]|uniref:hypothetical protein n=1 Tax=Entamoeba invadens IP1 TaxID=370355 RepID=UPI0002C3F5CD|nr:hypothetical protein EIN_085550 [Entamoeba invadens IP1]ELP85313.1 hypothetical protein EIN_085550 [Entamoeba invadens IP1]|eukprot:XP_004184659.1 hypothetical protein EIN_085550 [Entamoeba invadens IP1]